MVAPVIFPIVAPRIAGSTKSKKKAKAMMNAQVNIPAMVLRKGANNMTASNMVAHSHRSLCVIGANLGQECYLAS